MQHNLFTKTNNSKLDLLNPVKNSLLTSYPEKEGWKLYNRYNWATKVFDFVLQKEDNNQVERILVEINFEGHISAEHFTNLDSLANRLSTGKGNYVKKIMIVEDLATMESTPIDVEVLNIGALLKDNHLGNSACREKLVA